MSPTTEVRAHSATAVPTARRFDLARYRDLSLVPVLLVLGVIGFVVSPAFLTSDNLRGVGQQATELSLLVLAEALVLIAGRMDLSLESTIGVAPVIAVWLVLPDHGARFNGIAGECTKRERATTSMALSSVRALRATTATGPSTSRPWYFDSRRPRSGHFSSSAVASSMATNAVNEMNSSSRSSTPRGMPKRAR